MAEAFPDLNKDGEVTRADVLMGRGVDLDRDDKAMGSLMVPREGFNIGSIASKAAREVFKKFSSKKASKAADGPADGGVEEGIGIDNKTNEKLLSTRNKDALFFSKKELDALKKEVPKPDAYAEMIAEFAAVRMQDEEIIKMASALGYSKKEIKDILEGSQARIEKLRDDFHNLTEKRIDEAESREFVNEGGSMLVPPEMEMPVEEPPVDTYDNISPEEEMQQAEDMLPDDEMEEEYVDYVAEEILEPEEQEYLFKVLDEDPRLEGILDKIILNSTEFAGAGEVEGPGTGISDSIPARLSDGEFVITEKATDQIGADNLQTMMDDAERAYNGGLMAKAEGGMPVEGMERYDMEKDDEDTLNRQMAYANRMPSLMNR